MKKYLLASTLIAASFAFSTPAFAALGYGSGGGIVCDQGKSQDFTGDVTFSSGSYLTVANSSEYAIYGRGSVLFDGSVTISVTGTSSLTLTGGTTFSDEDGAGPLVTIAGGSNLITSDAVTVNGGTISIDETSTWTSGDKDVITFGATAGLAISTTANSDTASVQLGEVYFYEGASVSITVDLSDIDLEEGISIALFEATSITFDYNGSTGTTLTDSNIDYFMENYVTFTGGDVEVEGWSYDAETGIISATVTYLPEPSAFGLFFGLGAIGLVATRRRRKVA